MTTASVCVCACVHVCVCVCVCMRVCVCEWWGCGQCSGIHKRGGEDTIKTIQKEQ